MKSRNKREGKWIPYGKSTITYRNAKHDIKQFGPHPRNGDAFVEVVHHSDVKYKWEPYTEVANGKYIDIHEVGK